MKIERLKFIHTIFACLAVYISVAANARTAQSGVPPSIANGISVIANGIVLTVTPGSPPTITAASATDGSPIAIPKNLRFVDKHGRNVDPASITLETRFQAIYDSGPNGPVIQQVMVDRD